MKKSKAGLHSMLDEIKRGSLDYLKVDNVPPYYKIIKFFREQKKGNRRVNRVVEADLVTMQALVTIGFNRQDWDNTSFIKAAERWGAKNVMFRIPRSGPYDFYTRIPKNVVVEGRESLRYGNGTLYGASRVMVWINMSRIVVHLTEEHHDKAHLVHPNCEIVLI